MKTVASMIEELKKFPPDAMCAGYERDVCGLVVESPAGRHVNQGFIHCGPSCVNDPPTEIFQDDKQG